MTQSRRVAVIAGCVLVVVPATAAVAVSGVVRFGSVTPSSAIRPAPPIAPTVAAGRGGVASVPASVAAAFGAFRRPQNAQDRAVALSTAGLSALGAAQGDVGADPSLARTVLSNSTATVALVPADATHLCMLGSAGGETTAQCAEASEAETSGIAASAGGDHGGELLYGAMPDGTHNLVITDTSGKTTPVVISAGGGFAVQLAAAGTTMTYVDGNGQTKREPIFVPPPPPPPHGP
jgi:hypothetical protein